MRRFVLLILIVFVLTIPVRAHPGGTDGNGGHYDHSTGEYHYHHGYGAHDHEDLDGDGVLDCPYNFKDKTGESSGQSSGSGSRYPASTRPPIPLDPTVAQPKQESGLKTVWEIVKATGIVIVAFVVMLFGMMVFFAPIMAVQFAVLWLRDRFGKHHKELEWKPSPQRIPGKRHELPQSAEQLSFFDELKCSGDPEKLIWKSAYDDMKYTKITDRYIHIKDLEYVAGFFAVDTDTALRLLNDDRIHNDMLPLEVLKA